MDVVRTVSDLAGRDERQPLLVMASPNDRELLERAVARLELPAGEVEHLEHRSVRPLLKSDGDRSVLLAVLAGRGAVVIPFTVCATPGGILIVCEQPAVLDPVLAAVAGIDGPGAIARALAEVGRISEDNLEALGDEIEQGDHLVVGYLSQQQRKSAIRLRARLVAINNLFAAQRRLIARDEEFAQQNPGTRDVLRIAASRFGYVCDVASRQYASLGDALDQQSVSVTERLTLVNTIFLPLTLVASFFGMNFAWMTDRITGVSSFVLLGMVTPVLLALATVLGLRRLVR
jgi:hypothetical protein